ncbi:MAG: radical SAM protein [Planctomycetota bacterium]
MTANREQPESLIIRPPSECRSMLVRLTRGCHWNRCRFCGIYPALGEPTFSIRTVSEVKKDIDILRARVSRTTTAFLGDSDPLQIGLDEFIEIVRYLRGAFPEITRLTCYARASTLWKAKEPGIRCLAQAGLNRVHIGLESGDPGILRYHRKGQTSEIVVATGQWLRKAGIEVSFYVLLGMGGRDRWKPHIENTVRVIERVDPEFVRIRRIWLYGGEGLEHSLECPLWEDIRSGVFILQTPEGTVLELRLLIEKLKNVETFVTCDHANNYVCVHGRVPQDRSAMLEVIDQFLRLPEADRQAHYEAIGSRI